MFQNFLAVVLLMLIAAFTFDVSFNLRRALTRMDSLWRKINELDETLKKKY